MFVKQDRHNLTVKPGVTDQYSCSILYWVPAAWKGPRRNSRKQTVTMHCQRVP